MLAEVSETYPTRARDRSLLGYRSGGRKTASRDKTARSKLNSTVMAVKSGDLGLGKPSKSVLQMLRFG
jgi:hypothetical protein